MSALLELYLNQFLVFLLVLTRLSGLVMTAPAFGARTAPLQVRATLAIGLALLITPLHWDAPIPYPGNLLNFAVMIGQEAVLGLSLGVALMILFSGIQLSGQVIGQMSGIHLADVFDPSFNASMSVFSKLLDLIAVAVFVAIGGHRQVMHALLDTFHWIPPGSASVSSNLVQELVNVARISFEVGVRAAAPVVIALLMSVLIMGLISRTLPQLNILAVGFSLNSMVMLGTLALSLGTIMWILQDQVHATIEGVRSAFQASVNSS